MLFLLFVHITYGQCQFHYLHEIDIIYIILVYFILVGSAGGCPCNTLRTTYELFSTKSADGDDYKNSIGLCRYYSVCQHS